MQRLWISSATVLACLILSANCCTASDAVVIVVAFMAVGQKGWLLLRVLLQSLPVLLVLLKLLQGVSAAIG